MFWENFFKNIGQFFEVSGLIILKAVIIFGIGLFAIKFVLRIFAKMMARGKVDKTARKFLLSLIKYTLYLLLIIVVLSAVGVSITGFIAVLSAAGLAISLAMQNSLSNLAGGIILVILKPFKEGDLVKIGNFDGVIKEIRMMHTVVYSNDSKEISIPNKMVIDNAILNSSVLETRKITFEFLVSYKSDVEKVKEIILKLVQSTNLVLKEPTPFVGLQELSNNGLKFIATLHVKSKDYSKIYYPLLEEIFNEFKKQGIVLPLAQLEVNLKNEKENNLPYRKEKKLPQKLAQPTETKTKTGKEIMNDQELEELEEIENKKVQEKDIFKKSKDDTSDDDNDDDNYEYEYLDLVNEVNVIENEGETNTDSQNNNIDEIEKLFESEEEYLKSKNEKQGWKNKIFGKPNKEKQAKKAKIIIKKNS